MDNQTVITARDIKEILKSLKSDEEFGTTSRKRTHKIDKF